MTASHAAARPAEDPRGFRNIFEREFDYVWLSLRRLGVHERDLEDVAQEVFVQVHKRLADYDPERPIRPWLFAFAFRCASSDWRRLARHRVELLGEHAEPPASAPGSEASLARAQDVVTLMGALEEIDLDRRAVFILFELDECPMKEIAERLGLPLFTAYSRLRVAREEFAAAARRLQAEEGGR